MSTLRWGLRNGLRELYQSLQRKHHFKKGFHVQLKSNILNGMSNKNYGIPNHITLETERCLDGSLFKVDLRMHILVCIYSYYPQQPLAQQMHSRL